MKITTTSHADTMRGQIDTVIFDMDGVLLDITDSIRVVNCLAVPFYLRECLGWPAKDDMLSSDDIEMFKNAGGFNDDWDLTYSLVLHYLVKGHDRPDDPPETLNVLPPTLRRFANLIKEKGGGLRRAEKLCLSGFSRQDEDRIESLYNKSKIRKVFQELLGGEHCQRLYGFAPSLYHGPAWINQERPLLNVDRLPVGKTVAVLTGRTQEEAEFGLEVTGLHSYVDRSLLATKTDGYQKPGPEGLLALAKQAKSQTAIYIGDTIDDLRTVQNANRISGDVRFLSAQVLTGPAGAANEALFRSSGADLVASDVNQVLDWVTG